MPHPGTDTHIRLDKHHDHPSAVTTTIVGTSVHATHALLDPGTYRVGLFLPTAGLHHLLLHDLARPLVVTSGNIADEPIATDDAEARLQLDGIADGFLMHDRPIRARYDDSVVQAVGRTVITVCRARGLAPAPMPLPRPATIPLVAVGAQLKHTFA
ncbi:Sua5/YciO/YrdC/YwlC family protein, partial [Streptomyces sp. WM6378]|uniref:Sua5/YciO/YrdC/YwlC family protein n=1 Tax=Streptomyces sp. WM6378 TaxID=1415557 RepID=UPI0018FF04AB